LSGKQSRDRKYFKCSDGERAAFEAGIKLGAIYHQYLGIPVTVATASLLEKMIEQSTLSQPHVISTKVRISRKEIRAAKNRYGYSVLSDRMLSVTLAVKYHGKVGQATLRYEPALDYPLMRLQMKD